MKLLEWRLINERKYLKIERDWILGMKFVCEYLHLTYEDAEQGWMDVSTGREVPMSMKRQLHSIWQNREALIVLKEEKEPEEQEEEWED